MLELIANGLGLAGTGVSLVSGFALDKKMDVMSSSLARIEHLQSQLLEQTRSNQQIVQGPVSLVRNFGRELDPREQLKTAQMLAEYSRQLQSDLKASTSRILNDVVSEMRKVVESVRLTISGDVRVPRDFARAIAHNPFDAGIVEFATFQNVESGVSTNLSSSAHTYRRFGGRIPEMDSRTWERYPWPS
jgi:ribosomal protein S10